MSEQPLNQSFENSISLEEIIKFFYDFWKVIVGFGFLGLLSGYGYLLITPNKYEAKAYIKMAQISSGVGSISLINVEEPSMLVERLKMPSAYSSAEIKACGLEDDEVPGESLVGMFKFSLVNGAPSVVMLKTQMESKNQLASCMQSVFEGVRDYQSQIMRPFIEEAKSLLIKYEFRLKELREYLARSDKSSAVITVTYLASRDELKFLNDEIARLVNFIVSENNRKTALVSPIYSSERPVFPKKKIALFTGLMLGLFLGFFLAVVYKIKINFKVDKQ